MEALGEDGVPLNCGHLYHAKCVIPWLQKGGGCPTCRDPQNEVAELDLKYPAPAQRIGNWLYWRDLDVRIDSGYRYARSSARTINPDHREPEQGFSTHYCHSGPFWSFRCGC